MKKCFKDVISILAVIFAVSGCSDRTQLEGDWVLDEDYTFSHIGATKEQIQNLKDGDHREEYVGSKYIEKFKDQTIVFTPSDLIYLDENGNGKSESYKIVGSPASGVCRIRFKNGRIQTWTEKDERLSIVNYSTTDDRIYFRRPNK